MLCEDAKKSHTDLKQHEEKLVNHPFLGKIKKCPTQNDLPFSSLFSHLSWWRRCEPTRSWWTCCHRLNWSLVQAATGETTREWETEFMWELKQLLVFYHKSSSCSKVKAEWEETQYKSEYNIHDTTWHTTGNCDRWIWRPSMPRGKTAANASTQPTAVMLFRYGWEFWMYLSEELHQTTDILHCLKMRNTKNLMLGWNIIL